MIQSKRGRPPNFWTAARERQLIDMNARGATDGEIAQKLGVTRNTIIGKRTRMGLAACAAVTLLTPDQRRERKAAYQREYNRRVRGSKPRAVKAALLPAPVEPEPIGPLNDIAEGKACRWVHGTPGTPGWRMCGQPRGDGVSYCDHHQARAWARNQPQAVAA